VGKLCRDYGDPSRNLAVAHDNFVVFFFFFFFFFGRRNRRRVTARGKGHRGGRGEGVAFWL
jgi:hypothetical protein